MDENFEVKGFVKRIEQRTPGLSGLERLQNFDSFDVDFSPARQILRITYYTNSGTVYKTQVNVFDSTGVHVRTIFLNSDGSETGRTDLEHDERGRCTGWVDFDAAGGVLRRCNRQFAGDRITTIKTMLADGRPVSEKELEYSGNLLAKSFSKYYGKNGDLGEQWISLYEANSRVAETWGLTAEGKPLGDGRYKYEYDEEGRQSRVLSFNDWDAENVPNAITVCEYHCDESGNWVERRKHHRFRSDSRWSTTVTTRKITYWPT